MDVLEDRKDCSGKRIDVGIERQHVKREIYRCREGWNDIGEDEGLDAWGGGAMSCCAVMLSTRSLYEL